MRKTVVAAVFSVVALCGLAQAQQGRDFSHTEIKTIPLGNNAYMMTGEGGNMTIVAADDGLFMVDSQFGILHDRIKAAIASVTKQSVRYLIDTHFHADHTDGNELFAKEGVTVVAHANVKSRLITGTVSETPNWGMEPGRPGALPTQIYTDSLTLHLKGRTAILHHTDNAHTDGDTYVYFPEANVLATGDVVNFQHYPGIDLINGGNINGILASEDACLKLANDQTKIVPGHGPVGDKARLVALRAIVVDARDRVAKLIAQGKTEQEAIAAKPLADLDKKVSADEMMSNIFVHQIYKSLKH